MTEKIYTIKAKVDHDGHLRLDVPGMPPDNAINLTLTVRIAADPKENKYDFSDLVGTLEWKGDAVATQRNLRNEW